MSFIVSALRTQGTAARCRRSRRRSPSRSDAPHTAAPQSRTDVKNSNLLRHGYCPASRARASMARIYCSGLVHVCLQTSCWVVQLRVQGALPAGIQGARRRSDYDTGVLTVHDLRITGDQASRGYLRRYQWSRCQRDWLDQPWGYYLPRAGLFVPDVDPAVQSTNLPFRYL
jgi:hypothetical protein